MELAQISRQGQLHALAEVMDSLDFGFVEMDPNQVIALERQHETITTGVFNGRHPAADLDLLDYAIRRHYPSMPKMSAVLRDLKEEIPARYKAIADRFEASLTPMVERARAIQLSWQAPRLIIAGEASVVRVHHIRKIS